MEERIEKAPLKRGLILLFLLSISLLIADSAVGEIYQTALIQTNSQRQLTGSSPYQWIKVLYSTEPFQIVVIDKASQTLDVLEYANGSFTKTASFPCATGAQSGKKIKSGDSRTPEGVYFITKSFNDSKITIFGKRAFHLDYPNVFDMNKNRNGDGIYIHGTNKKLVPNSTNGCITMQNKDLDVLAPYLIAHKTPIVILDDKMKLQKLPVHFSGIDQETLLALLIPEELAEAKYTIHNLFVISSGTQKIAAGKFTFPSRQSAPKIKYSRAYLFNNGKNKWFASKQIFRGKMVKIEPAQKKIVVAGAKTYTGKILPRTQKTLPTISEPKTRDQVLRFIEKWRQAWQNKRLEEYIDCYANNFRQGRKNLQAWKKYKGRLNRKYRKIRVSVNDIDINWEKDGAKVLFHQIYRSDSFFADGRKMLVLTHSDKKGWQIVRESWLN